MVNIQQVAGEVRPEQTACLNILFNFYKADAATVHIYLTKYFWNYSRQSSVSHCISQLSFIIYSAVIAKNLTLVYR